MNLYYCIFIIIYFLVIFGPGVEGCTARPIKSDRMAICVGCGTPKNILLLIQIFQLIFNVNYLDWAETVFMYRLAH